MSEGQQAVQARRWLVMALAFHVTGMLAVRLSGSWWLLAIMVGLSSILTAAGWKSIGAADGVLRTEKSLDISAAVERDRLVQAETPFDEDELATRVRAVQVSSDSSVGALGESDVTRVAQSSSRSAMVSASAEEQAATTLRVARSLRPPSPSRPSSSPETLDSDTYELLEKLGAGNMGEIWRGRHRRLDRRCAIKILRKKAADWEDEQRFEREARVMAGLSSPHTVEIYDFGIRQDGSFYYVMELLDGIDLQKLVGRHGPLDPRRVIHILRQACHSLEDAHAAGLVHRDLKPANLVLCRYGRDWDMVKVVDFGLAKESVAKPGGAQKLTRMRTVLGTAAYLAPESRTGSVHVDHRADLYGLACIAFWLLSGRLVFDEKNPIRMVNAHVTQEPRHVREFVPEVNEDLDSLIHKCLAKDPADRIQDARAMRTALDAMSRDEYWTDAEAREWWESQSESP